MINRFRVGIRKNENSVLKIGVTKKKKNKLYVSKDYTETFEYFYEMCTSHISAHRKKEKSSFQYRTSFGQNA